MKDRTMQIRRITLALFISALLAGGTAVLAFALSGVAFTWLHGLTPEQASVARLATLLTPMFAVLIAVYVRRRGKRGDDATGD
jgi:hypothetical protein